MKVLVSGLINIETTLKIKNFPISYYPIDYPFYGVHSNVAGVAYNLSKAFMKLGDSVTLFSYLGKDEEMERIMKRLREEKIATDHIRIELNETPASVVLYDEEGKRQIYCDLKNIQEQQITAEEENIIRQMESCDLITACNINFNRPLIKKAKELGKVIATDVHVLSDIEDSFNKDFMECADILFLSDEQLPCEPEIFIQKLKDRYFSKIIVIGMGRKGAMLYERQNDKIYQMEAVPCSNVINTVGAGDALYSSFLHYYLKGFSPLESLARAELFASIKIGYNGASNGFSDEKTIEELILTKKPVLHEI